MQLERRLWHSAGRVQPCHEQTDTRYIARLHQSYQVKLGINATAVLIQKLKHPWQRWNGRPSYREHYVFHAERPNT